MDRKPKSVDIADFIASWPKIIQDLDSGVESGIDVTRDGRIVALLRPPRASLYGYLRGSVRIPDGWDLTTPAFEGEIHAEHGLAHE